jgi:peptidoglycan-N-acetylglucosamine deacetylase
MSAILDPARPGATARARRWKPALSVWLSVLVHFGALACSAVEPELWRWALGAIVANHLLLVAAVLWPRGTVVGPNLVRLPPAAAARNEISLNFDDGPDPEVTPRVLEVLDRYQARASFFCIGRKAAVFPELVREIVRRGHSVENHSHHHSLAFAFYGYSSLKREVEASQRTISGISGQLPTFFRAPAGFRSPLLDPVMAACELRYVSWTRRGFDTVSSDADAVLERLAKGFAPGDILLMHDGGSARTSAGDPVVLAVLPRLLELAVARGFKPVTLAQACRDEFAG